MIECLRRWCLSIDEKITKKHLIHDPKIDLLQKDKIKLLKLIWREMCDVQSDLPMSHDGYLKLYQLSKPEIQCDVLLVDEAQDSNLVTLDIFLRHKGKKILVGDENQAIYHWRGANNAIEQCNADKEFFLTTSFRFGKNIAAIANTLLFNFKDVDLPITGFRASDGVMGSGDFTGQKAFIARTNGTLFEKALESVESNQSIHFLGNASGYSVFLEGLKDVFYLSTNDRGKIKDIYISSFDNYYDFRDVVNHKDHPEVEFQSRIRIVEKYKDKFFDAISKIQDNIVPREDADIILATAHKSKGSEFDNVILADDYPSLLSDGHLKQDVLIAEVNLLYVAATRAKKILQVNRQIIDVLNVLEGKEEVIKYLANNNSLTSS